MTDEVEERVVDVYDGPAVEIDDDGADDSRLVEAGEARRRFLGRSSCRPLGSVGPSVRDGECGVVGEGLRHLLVALVEGWRGRTKAEHRERTDGLAAHAQGGHEQAVDSDLVVDLRDLGRETGPVDAGSEERLAGLDQPDAPRVVRNPLRS